MVLKKKKEEAADARHDTQAPAGFGGSGTTGAFRTTLKVTAVSQVVSDH
jgi:hypothetical protein